MPFRVWDRVRRVNWRPWLLGAYALSVLVVATPKGLHHSDNNFLIFDAAFRNLRAGRDLYAPHPEQYLDLFKYSPAFAVLFAPISALPDTLGLVLWDAINTMLLAWAIVRLMPDRRGDVVLALTFLEMFGSMQHSQSNSLLAALVILAFLALEAEHPIRAALALAIGTAVKIFPIAGAAMALPRPRRFRFAVALGVVLAVVLALPFLVVAPHEVKAQYASWMALLPRDAVSDTVAGRGMHTGGVPEQLHLWFGTRSSPFVVEVIGAVLLVLPLVARWKRWADPDFRVRFLASLLVFLVIFNHRSESPSFVIAMVGIAIWFAASAPDALTISVMAAAFIIVSLGASSAVPNAVRVGVVMHYRLKTLPCVIAWLVMQAELWGWRVPRPSVPALATLWRARDATVTSS
ncbi:MAG TPA: glycosyltransferase family 87 protein [Gemmatimonadaceae bacterium]|nr:glycosyltransferase family 87 protein [Gemmatimonadaceae bacterium]